MLNEELLLPSEPEIDVGSVLDWVLVSPVPKPSETLLSLTEIETTFDEAVGFFDGPTGEGGAVAIDTSPPSEEVEETDEGIEGIVKVGLEGVSFGVTEVMVTFWTECCRRKRTRMAVSLWMRCTEQKCRHFDSSVPSPNTAAADTTTANVEVRSKARRSCHTAMPVCNIHVIRPLRWEMI